VVVPLDGCCPACVACEGTAVVGALAVGAVVVCVGVLAEGAVTTGALAGALPGCCAASRSDASFANLRDALEVRRTVFAGGGADEDSLEDAAERSDAAGLDDDAASNGAGDSNGETQACDSSETKTTSSATFFFAASLCVVAATASVFSVAVVGNACEVFLSLFVAVARFDVSFFSVVFGTVEPARMLCVASVVLDSGEGRTPPHDGVCFASVVAATTDVSVFFAPDCCAVTIDVEAATHNKSTAAIQRLFVE
jgi:hypothetical protein